MDLDITKHGDALEKEFSYLILDKIPKYNLIWKKYIGHDGSGKMLPPIGLSDKQKEKRVLFAEYHYTILESVIGIHVIIFKSDEYSFKSVKDLILQNNDIISFHAHVGRIRDCIKKIGELFSNNGLYLRFDKCWKERCAVLHSKKLPMAIIDGIYLVLKDAELIEDNKQVQSWNDCDADDFNFLSDYLKTTYESIINEVNSSLAAIYDNLKNEFTNFKFDFTNFNTPTTYDFLSGATAAINPIISSANLSRTIIFDKK